jgi:hypothetical protein
MAYWYGSNNEFPPGQSTLGQSYFHSGGIAAILFCKFLWPIIYFDPQTPKNLFKVLFTFTITECFSCQISHMLSQGKIKPFNIGRVLSFLRKIFFGAFNKALFDCHQVTFNSSFNNLQIVIRPIGKLLFQCIFISR